MSFIEITDLVYRYGADMRPALDGINLSIGAGEFVAVLGANGSGKSTLAKHLNAILLPTAGKVLIDGLDTADERELWNIRQRVGMVFQNPDNQLIAAIVEDDVAFGPENLGRPPLEIEQSIDTALNDVRMEKFRTFSPHLLSGGQKQRIAIAGALAMKTRCLVLDEPTAMLDPLGRAEVLSTAKRLHDEQGITIVYITHFMEEAAAAERVIVMDGGKIAADGTPREVFRDVRGLKDLGLDVPLAAEIAWRLKERGKKIADDILTDEELVTALCQ